MSPAQGPRRARGRSTQRHLSSLLILACAWGLVGPTWPHLGLESPETTRLQRRTDQSPWLRAGPTGPCRQGCAANSPSAHPPPRAQARPQPCPQLPGKEAGQGHHGTHQEDGETEAPKGGGSARKGRALPPSPPPGRLLRPQAAVGHRQGLSEEGSGGQAARSAASRSHVHPVRTSPRAQGQASAAVAHRTLLPRPRPPLPWKSCPRGGPAAEAAAAPATLSASFTEDGPRGAGPSAGGCSTGASWSCSGGRPRVPRTRPCSHTGRPPGPGRACPRPPTP